MFGAGKRWARSILSRIRIYSFPSANPGHTHCIFRAQARATCLPVILLVVRIMTFGNRLRASNCVRRAFTALIASVGSDPPTADFLQSIQQRVSKAEKPTTTRRSQRNQCLFNASSLTTSCAHHSPACQPFTSYLAAVRLSTSSIRTKTSDSSSSTTSWILVNRRPMSFPDSLNHLENSE